jgi:Na+/H+ antiporter NhaD/arsenite permease-like protein
MNLFGIPLEFVLFALTLLGIALFHHHTLKVALIGLAAVTLYKLLFVGFKSGAGVAGVVAHLGHEWVILANLFGLLVGFTLLSKHFEDSKVPAILPRFLPNGWVGGFVLLLLIWFISSFLDNIAAALIGGTVAATVFRGKVHIGYLAGIVAASNAGGSWSVLGDTTTTMMWIAGVSPLEVAPAFVAASVAVVVCGIPAALQQQNYSPISNDAPSDVKIDKGYLFCVFAILLVAVAVNITVNSRFNAYSDLFPWLGAAVWVAIFATSLIRKPDWSLIPSAAKGSIFLLSLVLIASMMPVEKLPVPSWQTTFGLGFVSSVFDNIPLTALALKQGGYDWGLTAFAVGFGGSMLWFGSTAGVALSNNFPEAKNAVAWLKNGWHVALAYVVGFLVMFAILGWNPAVKKVADLPAQPTSQTHPVFQIG